MPMPRPLGPAESSVDAVNRLISRRIFAKEVPGTGARERANIAGIRDDGARAGVNIAHTAILAGNNCRGTRHAGRSIGAI